MAETDLQLRICWALGTCPGRQVVNNEPPFTADRFAELLGLTEKDDVKDFWLAVYELMKLRVVRGRISGSEQIHALELA